MNDSPQGPGTWSGQPPAGPPMAHLAGPPVDPPAVQPSQPSGPPPAWIAQADGTERWWDGTQWTQEIRGGQTPETDAAGSFNGARPPLPPGIDPVADSTTESGSLTRPYPPMPPSPDEEAGSQPVLRRRSTKVSPRSASVQSPSLEPVESPSNGVPRGRVRAGQVVRMVGLIAIAIAAVVVLLGMPPATAQFPSSAVERGSILALGDMREDDAETAAQQSVVAQWTTNELLELESEQLDDIGSAVVLGKDDERPVILLALGVCALCLIGATAPIRR